MSLEADRAELVEMLRAAMKVELTTIPLYATAAYTIAEEGEYARIAPEQANAEPAETIRQVMLEEMLHLALAANLLNAVKGEVVLDRAEAIPAYPCAILPSGKGPVANLRRFSKDQVRLFREIERAPPNFDKVKDGNWKKAETIGGFYHCVEMALDAIVKAHGEQAVFTGEPVMAGRAGALLGRRRRDDPRHRRGERARRPRHDSGGRRRRRSRRPCGG